MYLHIGQDTVLRTDEIVGVFDLDNTTWSASSRAFLNRAERENRVFPVSGDIPRSFVLCTDGQIYLSPLTSATLRGRGDAAMEGAFWNG